MPTVVELLIENTTDTVAQVKIKDRIANKTLDSLRVVPGEVAHYPVKREPASATDARAIRVCLDTHCYNANQNLAGDDANEYFTAGNIQIKKGCKLANAAQ
jgi:hypothetical protein